MFLKVGLPSQMTPGNLLSSKIGEAVYEIYTTGTDAEEIRAAPIFKRLEKTISVRFIAIDSVMSDNKWRVLRHCHREAVKSADQSNASLFFLCPDQIWSENSFENAISRIREGYCAVLCPGLRAVEEEMVPAVRDRFLSDDGLSLSVPARELVRLGLRHAHSETKIWYWDDPNYYRYPTYILFDVPGEGTSAFCYILHPVVINAQIRGAEFRLIFDQDYLEAACPDVTKIYIAQDTDEISHFEVSPADMAIPQPPDFSDDPWDAMLWFGEGHFNHQHREFVKKPIRIHCSEIDVEKWRTIESRGFSIVERFDELWSLSDETMAVFFPHNLLRRLDMRHRWKPDAETPYEHRLRMLAGRRIDEISRLKEKPPKHSAVNSGRATSLFGRILGSWRRSALRNTVLGSVLRRCMGWAVNRLR